jgi:hypothetical protein
MDWSYLPGVPERVQAIVEMERLKARRQLNKQRVTDQILRNFVLRVWSIFTRQACQLGLDHTWKLARVREASEEFLRLFTIEAWYEQSFPLGDVVSSSNGGVLPRVMQEYRKSAEWRRYERELLGVATALSKQSAGEVLKPTEPVVESCADKRKAMIRAYQREVLEKTGKRITQRAIWDAAGYETRTEGERWMRCDPKRINKEADRNIGRVLREKPHLR